MSSKVVVRGSELSGSGDKGASFGENSLLFAVDSRFLDNQVGIQSKDNSHAVIYNALIEGNNVGVHAYQKNLQYGAGGMLTVGNSVIEKNRETSIVGKRSEVIIVDSYIDHVSTTGKLPLLVQTDSVHRDQAQSGLPLETSHIDQYFTNHLLLINSDIRGTSVVENSSP